jgi:hypothetical protein
MGRLSALFIVLSASACAVDDPYFVSVLLPGDTFDTVGPYRVEAEVLAPNGVHRIIMRLSAGEDSTAYSDLMLAAVDETETGGSYYIELPGRPPGTVFRYYLQVVDGKRSGGGRLAVFPAEAPDTLASFAVLSR